MPTIRILRQYSFVGLCWVADTVNVLGSNSELVFLAVLESFDRVRGIANNIRQCRPEVIIFLLSFNHVSSQLGSTVVDWSFPRQSAAVGVHVFDGDVGGW